jgi:hypothetical protein
VSELTDRSAILAHPYGTRRLVDFTLQDHEINVSGNGVAAVLVMAKPTLAYPPVIQSSKQVKPGFSRKLSTLSQLRLP